MFELSKLRQLTAIKKTCTKEIASKCQSDIRTVMATLLILPAQITRNFPMMSTEKEPMSNGATAEDQNQTQENPNLTADSNSEENTSESTEKNPQEEINALNDKYIRLAAEFENYKRRTTKERVELFSSANRELMTALIPVLDDFERAFKNTPEEELNSEKVKGYQLIYNKMLETMKQKGLKPMDDCTGKAFDADEMDAITRIPAPTEELKSKVVDQIERGYKLGDKIVRFAKVVVGE
jgi:molecular chaperone GrpE